MGTKALEVVTLHELHDRELRNREMRVAGDWIAWNATPAAVALLLRIAKELAAENQRDYWIAVESDRRRLTAKKPDGMAYRISPDGTIEASAGLAELAADAVAEARGK